MIQNADKIKFRASAIHLIMKNDRSGKAMGETAKSYLKKYYREIMWDRHEEITTKQMERGKESEEMGITLWSLHTKEFYKKNEDNIENDFITGHPDIFTGKSITNVEEGFDIKCPWSLFTMPFKNEELDDAYRYQNLSYCALTNATKWTTVYTLLNLSSTQLDAEKRRWQYKMDVIDPDASPLYIEKCKDLERLFIYDLAQFQKDYPYYQLANNVTEWKWDIPRAERIVTFEVNRDNLEIDKMYARILECRQWLNKNCFNIK